MQFSSGFLFSSIIGEIISERPNQKHLPSKILRNRLKKTPAAAFHHRISFLIFFTSNDLHQQFAEIERKTLWHRVRLYWQAFYKTGSGSHFWGFLVLKRDGNGYMPNESGERITGDIFRGLYDFGLFFRTKFTKFLLSWSSLVINSHKGSGKLSIADSKKADFLLTFTGSVGTLYGAAINELW